MASLFKGIVSRVIKVKINGTIDQIKTQKIMRGLAQSKFIRPKALAIVINSDGGSLSQSKNIADILKDYGQKNKSIPIYSFVEDQCLGSANVLLTAGVKAYSTQMSIMGNFGYSWSSLWFNKFSEKYNVKQEYIYHRQNKVKFDPFKQLQPQSQKWMQNYLYLLEHDLKASVTLNRESQFRKKNMSKEDIEKKVFTGFILKPDQAVETGFIDGYKTFDELMNQNYSSEKVYDILKPATLFSPLKSEISTQ